MKQLLLVALLAAVAASALTVLGMTWMMPTAPSSPHLAANSPQSELSEVVKELAALRRDVAEAIRGMPRPSPTGSAVADGARSLPDRSVDPGAANSSEGAAQSTEAQAPVHEQRLVETMDADTASESYWKKESKATWMLRSERDVLAWFGPPERVSVGDNGVETWWYSLPERVRTNDRASLLFRVHAGRVIACQ